MSDCYCGGGSMMVVDETVFHKREVFRIECLRHCGNMTAWCGTREEAEKEWDNDPLNKRPKEQP